MQIEENLPNLPKLRTKSLFLSVKVRVNPFHPRPIPIVTHDHLGYHLLSR